MKKLMTFLFLTFFLYVENIYSAPETFTFGSPNANASAISLITTQTNLTLASPTLKTNGSSANPRTYRLTVTSANGGLKNANAISKGASTASATLPYTIGWQNSTGTMTAYSVTVNTTTAQTIAQVTDNANGGTFTGNIVFTRTGTSAASLYSGTYTDTLTIKDESVSPTAYQVGSTATLTLTAVAVADTITITVTPTASASNLSLATSQSQLSIGTVSITANCQNGYVVQVASSNSGKLVNTAAGGSPAANEYLNYSLFYQGTQITASSTPVTIATSNSATLITNSTQIGNVGLSYTGIVPTSMRAGTYQDNLTFTLTSQ